MEMMGTMTLNGSRTHVTMYTDFRFVKSATALGMGSGNVSASGSGGRTITARYRIRNTGIRVTCKHRLATIWVSAISPSFLLLLLLLLWFSSSFFLPLQFIQFLKLFYQYAVLILSEVPRLELLFHLHREDREDELDLSAEHESE